ncbi:MAG: hypothetical protein ABJE47_23305 [bacterium]
MPDMGTFRIDVELENPVAPGRRRTAQAVLIDTGAIVERWTGEARIHATGTRTIDEVVFGESADLVLLGARSLEGLNLIVDPVSKRLIDAGPVLAAATT